jgi:hypothetical protein
LKVAIAAWTAEKKVYMVVVQLLKAVAGTVKALSAVQCALNLTVSRICNRDVYETSQPETETKKFSHETETNGVFRGGGDCAMAPPPFGGWEYFLKGLKTGGRADAPPPPDGSGLRIGESE